jgi:hypothetical protein
MKEERGIERRFAGPSFSSINILYGRQEKRKGKMKSARNALINFSNEIGYFRKYHKFE